MAPSMMVATHYSLNGRHPSWGNGFPFANATDGSNPLEKARSVDGAKKPSDTWLSADGSWADLGISAAAFRHRLRANFSYLDGHAETLAPNQITYSTSFPAGISDARRLYNH